MRWIQHVDMQDWPRTKRMMLDFIVGMHTTEAGPPGATFARTSRVNDVEIVVDPTGGA